MASVILITNPSHDIATKYLDAWITSIIFSIGHNHNNVEICELKGTNATREELGKIIKDKNPGMVLFHGHGSHDSIEGYRCVLINCQMNLDMLKERTVHSLSCDSGKTLGPKLISAGSDAFVGYKEEFKFIHLNKSNEKERLSDPVAIYFLGPAFEAVKALIGGKTAREAYEISQDEYRDQLRFLLTANIASANNIATTIASLVYHNLTNQVCYTA